MARPDLQALTPEVLAALANVGLVKRAQKEAVTVDEQADGTVVGTFSDGATARWPVGVGLAGATCTCGAPSVCRHRLALPLSYRGAEAALPAPAGRTPRDIAPQELESVLSRSMLERARSALRQTVSVEVAIDSVPVARLPTCTVRFHVPDALAYARCDCRLGTGCEHLAIALWAWHTATAWPSVVSLGGGSAQVADRPLTSVRDLAEVLLTQGVTQVGTGLSARFEAVRSQLEAARMVWMADVVDDVESTIQAWQTRSARYQPGRMLDLLTELEVRRRAALQAGELPASLVLGTDVARETPLRQLRVTTLGVQIEAQETEREASVYLADPNNGEVLVLTKTWMDEGADGPALGARTVGPNVRLRALAEGQLISRVARRHANRRLSLGQGRSGETSVVPQSGEWNTLPEPLLVRRLAEFRRWAAGQPPALLQPRVLGGGLHVVAVSAWEPAVYLAGRQEVRLIVVDEEGARLTVSRRYRKVAPWALQTLAWVSTQAPIRFMCGFLTMAADGLHLVPLTVVTDRQVLPLDLMDKDPQVAFQRAYAPDPEQGAGLLGEAASLLGTLVHQGLETPGPDWRPRCADVVYRLGESGLAELAQRLAAVQATPSAATWMNAAVRLYLTAERSGAL